MAHSNSLQLSVVVLAYNMARELPRTLFTLSDSYQQGVSANQYEVIVIDNGSDIVVRPEDVISFGPQFKLLRREGCSSPAAAINEAVTYCRGEAIMVCIDGARMLSPGIINSTLRLLSAYESPVIATLAWHLGSKPQYESILDGYSQDVEDSLLASIDWRQDGYDLFKISCLAGSSSKGWLRPMNESNCLSMRRHTFDLLKGLDVSFQMAGGGMVNLDFYKRACEQTDALIVLLGEGTFHQFHNGVATNNPKIRDLVTSFEAEYQAIRGQAYTPPQTHAILHGQVPDQCLPFIRISIESVCI